MLRKKLDMYRVPLQQLKINYTVSTTNKKVYSEEEDRFLLVMLDKLGKEEDTEGIQLFERMREEIRESPLFRFDWFFLSRTPVELSRRCTTLLNTIAREFEPESKANGESKGRVRDRAEEDGEDEEDEAPAKKKSKNGAIVNKKLKGVKTGSKGSSANTSRAASVSSNVQTGKSKSKKK
jgi:SWI/SNF-related matrix-associated actin-dependent regulator of chromatin subfamily A member 5